MNNYTTHIATALGLKPAAVDATLTLLNEGCTIPFIARYRKERTGEMDEVQIAAVSEAADRLTALDKRRATILKTIDEQGLLTPELEKKINNCWDATTLEDLYLPYKPKRRTRAQAARQQGLEPLAQLLLMGREQHPEQAARRFVKGEVADTTAALAGAKDIIAETVSEDADARSAVRAHYRREAVITSKVIKKQKDTPEAQKFADYFDWSEPLRRCPSHRLLALRRGEEAGILRVSISADNEACVGRLYRQFVRGNGPCQRLVGEAVEDAFKRLIAPSVENEFAALSKEKADKEAISVFAENLRQLLLSAPLGQKRTLALDPGFANGCKTAVLDAEGNLLHHEIIYPHPPRNQRQAAAAALLSMTRRYRIEAIAIGNGTASRETEAFARQTVEGTGIEIYVVSEDGASIYSASATAREEFPNEDVTTRGAVSIGRRLMDPLAELVKIDPKSIGVGQYQHDVDQTKLKQQLDLTVESCVNQVGVNLNTASAHLLMYVSGLGKTLAQNIVNYRREHGAFASRAQLKHVPRLGPAAFTQCAGFLRIPGAKNPLDNSAVHPESYHVVEQMAKDLNCTVSELMADKNKQKSIELKRYVTNETGLPTLKDIMGELEKPGRDPRQKLEAFSFDDTVHTIDDLTEGMELPGIVTNITNFGAFVDIGVHQDGLVHISQLSDSYVSDPNKMVKLHQHVRVCVTGVDTVRHRISLSMKGVKQ